MTNLEIIRLAFSKAKQNGWEFPRLEEQILSIYKPEDTSSALASLTRGVVLSHAFAKAFWGENSILLTPITNIKSIEPGKTISVEGGPILAWRHHLQQMALEEDPVRYLEKFV